jgi:hypothetical protein
MLRIGLPLRGLYSYQAGIATLRGCAPNTPRCSTLQPGGFAVASRPLLSPLYLNRLHQLLGHKWLKSVEVNIM